MDTEHDEDELVRLLSPLGVGPDDPRMAELRAGHAALDPDEKQAMYQELRQAAEARQQALNRAVARRIVGEPGYELGRDETDESLLRQFKARGIDPVQWFALSRDARTQAFEEAGRERFKAWCAERGVTPKEMGERLSSDAELRVVREIDNATGDLMKALNRLHELGLSATTTTKWVKFHTDLRWRYGDDDGRPHELPTLVRFIESSWSVDSGLRLAGSDEARRQRKSDFQRRIRALRDAGSGSEWTEVTRTKLGLALELLREAGDSGEAGDSPPSPGDAESMFEYTCTMLGLDVSRRNSRTT
jgi:hypothetical protein